MHALLTLEHNFQAVCMQVQKSCCKSILMSVSFILIQDFEQVLLEACDRVSFISIQDFEQVLLEACDRVFFSLLVIGHVHS